MERFVKNFIFNPYLILIILMLIISVSYQYGTVEHYVVTIEEKERIVTGSGKDMSSKYLVFTDKKVFQNTDALFHLKFSSSDLQGRLKVGRTYKLKTYGWRIPFLSTYENIVSIED